MGGCSRRSAMGFSFRGARLALLAGVIGVFVLADVAPPRAAEESSQALHFFRIGTGASGGTYFPIGGVIASAISSPPGARPCEKGGSCGVPGLIAVAQSTAGSLENLARIEAGELESGLAQADLAYAAF